MPSRQKAEKILEELFPKSETPDKKTLGIIERMIQNRPTVIPNVLFLQRLRRQLLSEANLPIRSSGWKQRLLWFSKFAAVPFALASIAAITSTLGLFDMESARKSPIGTVSPMLTDIPNGNIDKNGSAQEIPQPHNVLGSVWSKASPPVTPPPTVPLAKKLPPNETGIKQADSVTPVPETLPTIPKSKVSLPAENPKTTPVPSISSTSVEDRSIEKIENETPNAWLDSTAPPVLGDSALPNMLGSLAAPPSGARTTGYVFSGKFPDIPSSMPIFEQNPIVQAADATSQFPKEIGGFPVVDAAGMPFGASSDVNADLWPKVGTLTPPSTETILSRLANEKATDAGSSGMEIKMDRAFIAYVPQSNDKTGVTVTRLVPSIVFERADSSARIVIPF